MAGAGRVRLSRRLREAPNLRAAAAAGEGGGAGAARTSPATVAVRVDTAPRTQAALRLSKRVVRGPRGARQPAIVVDAVSAELFEAGARRGWLLRGVSDPIRAEETMEVNGLSSLRFVNQAIRMRRSPYIDVILEEGAAVPEEEAAGPSGDRGEGGDLSVGEQLEQDNGRQELERTAQRRRIEARKARLEEVGQRNLSSPATRRTFAWVFALAFGPAALILGLGLANGWFEVKGALPY